MDGEALYQISLVAAFVAGMVALFAPCCITYLLPAYFGNVFKEKKKVLLMTLIYSAGIFTVMLPVVLGARIITDFFFRWHDQTYLIGGVFMVLVAGLAFLGVKMPMPKRMGNLKSSGTDVASTYTLGLIAGITSSCCAPVLVGVITLSSLSPTLLQSLGVGVAYVLGMVTPLYIAALLLDRGNVLDWPIFRKRLFVLSLGERRWPIYIPNVLAGVVFLLVGVVTIGLTLTGKLSMSMGDMVMVKKINTITLQFTEVTERLPGLDVVFVIVGVYLFYRLVKKARKQENKEE